MQNYKNFSETVRFSAFFCTFAIDMEESKQSTAYRQSLRERIIDTAMHAFATHGIKAVKMDDIAQYLGISKRTLYEVFDNKEVLLFEGVKKYKSLKEQEMAQVVSVSNSVMDDILYVYKKKVEEFRQVNPAFYSDMERYPQVLAFLEEDRRQSREYMFDFLKRGVAEGYFRQDVDYRLAIVLFEATASYVMEHQLYLQYSIEEIFHNILFVSLRGICTKRGQDVLDHFTDLTAKASS